MADAPYLIALALLEQGEQRSMPLQRQSLPEPVPADGNPGDVGRQQALELLVRVWQRSEGGALRRAAGEHSRWISSCRQTMGSVSDAAIQAPFGGGAWFRATKGNR
uniref:hypothetical protein n=1 Tax=Synechococcus sp. CS-1329 TaxID=2847975 RepID=UPI00223A843A|nr:hypothetical protein [Synechococcus sp. CS-1329]